MDYVRKHWQALLFGLLFFSNILIWSAVVAYEPKDHITVSFLDIGQGDSALIESTNGNRVLIDGGPNKIILQRLGEVLPYFNQNINVVIETHPDKDHIGGLPDVLTRMKVGTFLEPGVESPNSVDDAIHAILKNKNIPHMLARAGQVIDMGDGAELRILFPDRDVSHFETNNASVVAQLIYGDTCFLFTGDSPQRMEEYLVSVYRDELKCNVLKVGHHGSRTSTGDVYLGAVKPEYAIISAGKGNGYGHPHKEVVERLKNAGVEILSTAEFGSIRMYSDGRTVTTRNTKNE
jgi:competence protein ComEC